MTCSVSQLCTPTCRLNKSFNKVEAALFKKLKVFITVTDCKLDLQGEDTLSFWHQVHFIIQMFFSLLLFLSSRGIVIIRPHE